MFLGVVLYTKILKKNLEKFKTEFLPPLPGGVLKRVNLVFFFLKADSISIRVSIQDTKTKKRKNAFDPRYAQLKVLEVLI